MPGKKPEDVLCRRCGAEMMLIEIVSLNDPEQTDEIIFICDCCDAALRRRVVHTGRTTQITFERWQI
jgi:hypothetical protein